MSDRIAEIKQAFQQQDAAAWVSNMWDTWNNQRAQKLGEWRELRDYLFATDTRSTSNSKLPWKNSTTLPKLCQIRDNLHANYMAALFPNDRWLTWKAYTQEDASHEKATSITSYMSNKLREGGFYDTASRLVYDYIDWGNCFAMPTFERRYTDYFDEKVTDFVGPKAIRIAPQDIVFDPTASEFKYTPKIVRSVKTIGELLKLAETSPEHEFWKEAVENRLRLRKLSQGVNKDDFHKQIAYSVDGFGSLLEYYQSNYVEILEFYGDYYNDSTGELHTNRMITVVDRSFVARDERVPTYNGVAPIFHVGWRLRPDNLWAMGPLDNLVGLQYRLDHLENLRADAMDLSILPMLKIRGEVEEFQWQPGGEIHMDENGDVEDFAKNLSGIITAQSQMQEIEDRMELYAGAPREAMGIRTPGEKTAFEIDQLVTAAGRIFQEKSTWFEMNLLEPLLNSMYAESHRNFIGSEEISTIDESIGVEVFSTITKDDITANGVLRPVGARHFAQKSQDIINLNNIFNGPIGQKIDPHMSGWTLAKVVNDILNLRGYKLFSENIGILEAQKTQGLMNTAQEDLEVQARTPVEGMM